MIAHSKKENQESPTVNNSKILVQFMNDVKMRLACQATSKDLRVNGFLKQKPP